MPVEKRLVSMVECSFALIVSGLYPSTVFGTSETIHISVVSMTYVA